MHWELNRGEYSQLARNQTKYHGKENIWLDLKDQEAFHTEVLGVESVKNVKEEMDKDKKEPSGGLSTELGGKTKSWDQLCTCPESLHVSNSGHFIFLSLRDLAFYVLQ